jgi:Cu+-exporting ATPase
VTEVIAHGAVTPEELLRLAAALERASEHPLAAAILAEARERGLETAGVEDFGAVPGQGVLGTVDGRRVALGSAALVAARGADTRPLESAARRLREEGRTVVYVCADTALLGLIAVADPIKSSTPEALALLRREGLTLVMLTGDSETTARAVARDLGIAEVIAEVMPQGKSDVIERLQRDGKIVAMAGDGINDAPALAKADVGIAMGTGADVAIESAGITLVKGDLRGVARARRLAHATLRNVRQNLFFAFVYNTLGIPLAAGALYPFFGWLLNPMVAAAAMSVSSLSVIVNALRLRSVEL